MINIGFSESRSRDFMLKIRDLSTRDQGFAKIELGASRKPTAFLEVM